MSNQVFYDDGHVRLDHDGVIIRRYYFPLGMSKRIPYARIRAVRAWHMGPLTGKGRVWGSGDLRHWAPLDLHRRRKETALALDLGRWMTPVITPDDPARVQAILQQRVSRP